MFQINQIINRIILNYKTIVILIILGVTFYSILQSYFSFSQSSSSSSPNEQEITQSEDIKIFVHIDGCIKSKNVYSLKSGTRLFELIEMAGGYTEEADLDLISKKINLSEIIKDQGKYLIPCINNDLDTDVINDSATININMASIYELESINGIGEKTAEKIIQGRPFLTTEELVSSKIISLNLFEKIKDQISV